MYKILWCLRRKPGITFEQFRDHYERSHSVLGQKYFGHLIERYVRNYNVGRASGAAPGGATLDYDVVTEWVMPDEAAFDGIMALLADPEIHRVFHEDEEHFLHRESVLLIRCDPRDTGPGDGAETLRFKARA